jgi:GT2 family glycosyltransferase
MSETNDGKAGERTLGLVSVVMPHFNDLENLDVCLTLLEAQTFPRDRTEIIVADNGSACGIEAVRQRVGARARVIEATERGAGPARNAGVRAATGDALAFIDSDCRPDSRWLEEGLAVLQTTDIVGGRVDVLVDDPERMTPAEAFESVFAFRNDRYVEDQRFTVTASMFVWRSVFDSVGGFENGVPEDLDWCHRAAAKGFKIRFAPASIVGHPARRTMPELRRKWRRLTLEWSESARRRGQGAGMQIARQWVVLFSVVPHALSVMTTDRLNGNPNRLKAIAALAEIRLYRFLLGHRAAFQRSAS